MPPHVLFAIGFAILLLTGVALILFKFGPAFFLFKKKYKKIGMSFFTLMAILFKGKVKGVDDEEGKLLVARIRFWIIFWNVYCLFVLFPYFFFGSMLMIPN